MKSRRLASRFLVPLSGLACVCGPPAHASLDFNVTPYNATQLGTGSGVQLGHTVYAGTNMNRLVAGGSFVVRCDHPNTSEVPGSRTLTSAILGRYNQLYVTIPDTVPSLRNIPGFSSLPRGTELMCQYNWTGFAREPTYTIGVPPLSITVGGEEIEASGVVTFWMRKPGTATGDDDACLP